MDLDIKQGFDSLTHQIMRIENNIAGIKEILPKRPVEFFQYPVWLQHPAKISVLVYDTRQEEEYNAKGFVRKGSSSPDDALAQLIMCKFEEKLNGIYDRLKELSSDVHDTKRKFGELLKDIKPECLLSNEAENN